MELRVKLPVPEALVSARVLVVVTTEVKAVERTLNPHWLAGMMKYSPLTKFDSEVVLLRLVVSVPGGPIGALPTVIVCTVTKPWL